MAEFKILPLLKGYHEGLTLDRIQSELGVRRRERAKLVQALKGLIRDGSVRAVRDRYSLAPRSGLVRGRFVTSRRGFGFVTPAEGGQDIFVPARYAEGVLQGDEVEVLVRPQGKFGKPEGRVIRVLSRERTTILGIYKEWNGVPFLQPFDSPSPAEIPLKSKGRPAPRPGMIVEADRKTFAVTKIYGLPDDPGVDTQVIIRRHGLAERFGEEALREAGEIPAEVPPAPPSGRKDFRDWTAVTIDGEKAQDFDDAVSVRKLPGGRHLLGVHIADVSHYVRPGTALDRDAYARATSVYFPDRTLPMLPEKLSNDLCSLRPGLPRLAVSVIMEIDADGSVAGAEFTPSLIQTAARLTYASVFRIFEGDAREREKYSRLVPDLLLMRDLAALLRERRLGEGSLDFDLVEPELIYEQGKLLAVAASERTEAHRLIEEFMVAANVAVASFLTDREIPTIYRVHPVPAEDDLEKLRGILFRFGIPLPEAAGIRSRDLQRALEKARGRPEEKFIGIQILRAMKLAVYSPDNVGHYGLAKKDYSHFTSPIRRYPDLVVHRILKSVLAGEAGKAIPLQAAALHSSERERNADEAEKALLEWRIFRFLKDRLGDEFTGTVVDVVKAGLVVELDDYFVDGLLPFSAPDRVGRGRPAGKARRGRPEASIDLGARVRIILVSCDPFLQRMGFILSPDGVAEPR